MRVSLNWLAEWIDLPGSTEELCDLLTFGGLEIESVETAGPDLSQVRVGHVEQREPHPNADRLSLCRVNVGDGPVEIVCGAPNVAAGQKVAVISPGSRLPDGTKLKKSKIRGVVSNGMICSERELGLGEGHEGILVLPEDSPLGAPLADVLGSGDTVLDVEITPNRGDWACMIGMAREVRAHFGGELRAPDCTLEEDGDAASEQISISVDDPAGCYRYIGRIVRGVEVGPSPDWLVAKLEAAGLRSIDNIVDVTNLVLLEFGQPLHAFDIATLRGREIRVRRAAPDEKIATLDGQMRELEPADLVIADAERAVAIAGVMGGAETAVRPETRDILIECAHFDPSSVRRTARRLALHSDASYRFERGIDSGGLERAIDRAARLVAELAGGQIAPGRVGAQGGPFAHCQSVRVSVERPNRVLGTQLSEAEMISCLARVDIEARSDGQGQLECRIPSYRNDVFAAEDLIEEIARVHGYQNIPETLPTISVAAVQEPPRHALEFAVRWALAAAGLCETRTFPGTPAGDADALRLAPDDARRRTIQILNPHLEEARQLRTSLIPSLLRGAHYNLAQGNEPVRLFEVARHFVPNAAGELPDESPAVAAVLTQAERSSLWQPEPPVFFTAKGVLERLFEELGSGLRLQPGSKAPYLHPGAGADLLLGKQRVGEVGELHPEVAAHFGIDVTCAIFEVRLDALLSQKQRRPRYKEISRQPLVKRDLAVLVDTARSAGELIDGIRKAGGRELVSVDLFDRYDGKGIPDGKVSLAFRLLLQRPDRALTDVEITKLVERVSEILVERFGGEIR